MRTLLIISAFLLMMFLGCEKETKVEKADQEKDKMEMAVDSIDITEKLIYYTCPMDEHKHVHSTEPGKCSDCDMDLAAAVITSKEKMEFYGCPMEIHSHVRSDKEGSCADCGMELKPMRLDKKRQS